MQNKKRVLIIGLDGFTWNLAAPLIEKGIMPYLGSLIEKGSSGILNSIIPFETSPAWISFQTGCNPGKTGVFAFHTYDKTNKQVRLNSYLDIQVPTIWELADNAGRKIISVNMPITSPPARLEHGVIVPGLCCPGISDQTVWPKEAYSKYIEPLEGYNIVYFNPDTSDEGFVEQSIKTEQRHTQAALNIMNDIDWDIASVQMQSTDAYQHHFWGALHDKGPDAEEKKEMIYEFYSRCDDFIKSLVEKAGDDALTILASDHGFCDGIKTIGLNVWLRQKGYLTLLDEQPDDWWSKAKQKYPPLKSMAKHLGPMIKKDKHTPHQHIFVQQMESHLRRMVDIEKSKAFALGGMGGILYVRDEAGNKAQLIEEIRTGLLNDFGPGSDEHVIESIQPAEEVYGRCELDTMPDLIVNFVEGVEHRIDPLSMNDPNNKLVVYDKRFEGTHQRAGFFTAFGKDVKTGKLDCHLTDIAPTILAWMGLAVPEHIDGRVLKEIFISEISERRQEMSGPSKDNIEYSDEEQANVENQLRNLGYM